MARRLRAACPTGENGRGRDQRMRNGNRENANDAGGPRAIAVVVARVIVDRSLHAATDTHCSTAIFTDICAQRVNAASLFPAYSDI